MSMPGRCNESGALVVVTAAVAERILGPITEARSPGGVAPCGLTKNVFWRHDPFSGDCGIMSHATTALARVRPEQINMTIRNPYTNALRRDSLMAAFAVGSSPEGSCKPASLISFDCSSWRMEDGREREAKLRLR